MNFYTKTLMAAVALSALTGTAAAADVQTMAVKTGAGQDVAITTQEDGSIVVVNGGETLTGANAANWLQQQGVVLTVSPTGTVLGLDFKNGNGAVTQKPAFVKSAPVVAKKPVVVLPPNEAATSAEMTRMFDMTTGARLSDKLGDKPVSR